MAAKEEPKMEPAESAAAAEAPKEPAEGSKPAEEAPPPVVEKAAKHTVMVKIVKALGLQDDDRRTDSFVRVTLLGPEGETLATANTETFPDGGSEPAWDEVFTFRDIEFPSLCSVRMEIMDLGMGLEPGQTADSKTEFQLGRVQAVTGFQHFKEVIAASRLFSSKAELLFDVNSLGTWGNAKNKELNKVIVKVLSASNLKDMDGGLIWSDKNDPYCVVEMLHIPTNEVLKKVKTRVLQEAGAEAEWNQEFIFEVARDPCACKLKFSVWDKDVVTADDALGKTEFKLGGMKRKAELTEVEQSLELKDSNATLKFAIGDNGTWGNALEGPTENDYPTVNEKAQYGHMVTVKIVGATGLSETTPEEDGKLGKTDPLCRVTLRDEKGWVFQTFNTKVKKDAGSNAVWDETFHFKGFQNPGACTLALNVLDADNGGTERLGETSFQLGRLTKKSGFQEFEQDIAGFVFKSKVKFQIENKGMFGNSPAGDNTLYLKVKKAEDLKLGRLALSSSSYVYAELVDYEGKVLDKKDTVKMGVIDGDVTWDEELVFEKIDMPSACKLNLSVYSGMSKVGTYQLHLGTLAASYEYLDFDGAPLGGTGKLDFAIHTRNTFGHERGTTPATHRDKDDTRKTKSCCSVL